VNSTQVLPIAPDEPVRKKTIVIPAIVISVSANSSRWCSGRSDQSSAGGAWRLRVAGLRPRAAAGLRLVVVRLARGLLRDYGVPVRFV
jgi:hypothetical protein